MAEEGSQIEIIVQTGNLVTARTCLSFFSLLFLPSLLAHLDPIKATVGKPGEWKATQEWKLKVSSSLTPESLTELISAGCSGGTKLWPHEISIVGEDGKLTVLRQSTDDIAKLGVGNGTVLRFWNGKWEVK